MTSRVLTTGAIAALLGTGLVSTSVLLAQTTKPAAKPALGTFGVDTAHMDKTVKPGDDFFGYVNGTWLKTFKIPADKAAYGTFDVLNDKAEADIRNLLAELGKNP